MKRLSIYISILIVITALICTALTPVMLSAETSRHTDVMSDLMSDDTFNIANYPSIAKDYSLDVIQIAEGSDKSLFVYVYNPSSDRVATKLRMSVTLGEKYSPKDYTLKDMSHKGTLSKYLVEGYTVSSESKRYYDIISIYRAWDKSIGDEESGSDNVISEVAYKIGKNYTVIDTANNGVEYSCNDIEVIEITKKWSGSVRYNNGFHLWKEKCDSWFVAFDTDRRIETLKEADVSFVSERITYRGNNSQYIEDVVRTEHPSITVRASDVVTNDADGLFAKTYEWNRIEKVSDFISKEDLTDECKKNLEGKQWVLRFFESDYIHSQSVYGSFSGEKTKVTEVTILRLNFETLGKSYNLGVIDNYQSPDDKNDNNNDNELKDPIDDIKDWWERVKDWFDNMMSNLKMVFFVIFGLVLFAVLFPVIVYPIKWIIKEIKHNKEKKK